MSAVSYFVATTLYTLDGGQPQTAEQLTWKQQIWVSVKMNHMYAFPRKLALFNGLQVINTRFR